MPGEWCLRQEFTTSDMEGPFYIANVPSSNILAPPEELQDPEQFVWLMGTVMDRKCLPIVGATVEVWYAAGRDANGRHLSLGRRVL